MSAEKSTTATTITADQLPRAPHRPVAATAPEWTYRNLSAEEQAKHDRVLAHFAPTEGEYKLDDKPLDEAEKFWLSEECIQRFVRASKGVEETAKTRLEATLRWRREYGFDTEQMTPERLSVEGETGKQIIYGYDSANRPGLYLLPSRQNTDGPPRQIQFTVFMLERTLDLCDPGVESIGLLINFADRAKNPSLGTARTVLNILQDHYPERLGAAYIINVPFLVNLFLKAIFPFIDPKTRTKLHFNCNMIQDGFIEPDQLLTVANWGGNVEMDYDHSVYWPALLKLCGERHAREMDEWRKLGSKVGSSEWDIKTKAHGGYLGQAAPAPAPVAAGVPEKVEVPPVGAEKVVLDAESTGAVVTPADVVVAAQQA